MVRPAVRRGRSEGEGQHKCNTKAGMAEKARGHTLQMPLTLRLSLLRIDVRLPEVMQGTTNALQNGSNAYTAHTVQHAPKLPQGMLGSACHTIGGTGAEKRARTDDGKKAVRVCVP